MTKKYQPDRMPEPTRELTGEELEIDKANKWFVFKLTRKERSDIRVVAARDEVPVVVAMLAAYRARKDAGRPG